MPRPFMPPFDDPDFDTEAWYRQSPEEIRQAKEADAYQAWRNLSPVGMSDDERADWEANNDPVPVPAAADANSAGEDASVRAPRPIPSIGHGARTVLDLIAHAELPDAATNGDPAGYDTQSNYGKNRPPLPKPPTSMTLDEVDAHQAKMEQAGHSTAMGRYQVQRDTLQKTRDLYGLDGEQRFTPQMQDQIARTLIKRHGYDGYCRGVVTFPDLQAGLSGTWASLPNAKGVSEYRNSITGKPQPVRLTPEDLRTAIDQACRLDRGN